jgi:hypothetical protein
MKAVWVVSSVLLLSACAAAEPAAEPKLVGGKEVVCEYTVPTGSKLPTQRCRTADRATADRDDAQKALGGGHQRARVNGLGG